MDTSSKHGHGGDRDAGFVAPPERVRVVYRTRREPGEVELPLRLLLLGDYTQRPDPRPIGERAPIEVDEESLEKVMRQHKLAIAFRVEDVLSRQEGREIDVALRFRRLKDMEPGAVANQVPQLKAAVELRQALTGIKALLGGERAFRNALQRVVNDPTMLRRLRAEIGVLPEGEPVELPAPAGRAAVRALPPEVAAAREEAMRATHAEALVRLGARPEPAVRAAVAGNPDAPPDVLFELSQYCPAEVARNPVLPLLSVEIPDWLSRLSPGCVREVLDLGMIAPPEALLAQMCGVSDRLREIAAGDPRTPPAALADLARDRSWSVGAAALRNPSLPLSTWRSLVADPKMVVPGAHYPHAPADWLREAATHDDCDVREALAAHPGPPLDVLESLARDTAWSVRRVVARRKDLRPELARVLAADVHPWVRGEIAANPFTPQDLLPALADDIQAVRNGLLGNRAAPPALRERVLARNRAEWTATPWSTMLGRVPGTGSKP